jgi:acetyl-CoA carboxylase biotin carboxyl carrier protein
VSATTNGGPVSHPSHDVDEVVTVLREQVVALCAQVTRAPSVIRLVSGGVSVEVQWHETAPAAAAQTIGAASPARTVAPAHSTAGTTATATAPAPAERQADETPGARHEVCADTVGVFYRAAEPGATPFVSEGDAVRPGQQVAIIEAMKLMIPVEADRAGRVVEFLVDDGTAVEHGQPLFVLEPTQ